MKRIDYLNRPVDELDTDFIRDVTACMAGTATTQQKNDVKDLLTMRFLARICWLIESKHLQCDNWAAIESYLANTKEFQAAYETQLAHHLYFPLPITSKRQPDLTYGYFHQAVSEYFLDAVFEHEFTKDVTAQHGALLKLACEKFRSYSGLLSRADTDLIKVGNSLSSTTQENCIQRIIQDCNQLCDLYGAIGYVHAAKIHLALALKFEKPDITTDDSNRQLVIREQAVKFFLCAYHLRNDDYSNKIIDVATEGAGLPALFKEDKGFDFSSWDTALTMMTDLVGKDAFDRLNQQAKGEIETVRSAPSTSNVK